MKFKEVKEVNESRIDDYEGQCPSCSGKTTFYHELKCQKCNRTTITWCPRCERHVELELSPE